MFVVPLATSSTLLSAEKFWNVVDLYHCRPHLVNRKIAFTLQVLLCEVHFNSENVRNIADVITYTSLLYEVRRLNGINSESLTLTFVKNLLDCYDKNVVLKQVSSDQYKETSQVFVSVRIIKPRNVKSDHCVELVILDKKNNIASFYAVMERNTSMVAPPFPYSIELTEGYLRITVNNIEDADTSSGEWLCEKLFTKLLKWTNNQDEEPNIPSLSLISLEEYGTTYNRLKIEYGENLVKQWNKKAKTDPQKFVFEDLAIASYLICLWKKYDERSEQKIRFVDCGCGNGLLVYILNEEGYDGYGIDLRRRDVWDLYSVSTQLEVGCVTPYSKFPDCNWIIGNHSDELTAWIPIMATKSSLTTNFFVLPCCPYDLNGKKYIRVNTSVSQYADYLNYIKEISIKCGFEVDIDKLRIPSTKRTCLVGIRKTIEIESIQEVHKNIYELIKSKCFIDENHTLHINLKPAVEKARNCTQLDRNLIHKIVRNVVDNLLVENNIILKMNGSEWCEGGTLHLSELSKLIPGDDLKQLKKECGGLQTLLRNHRYLFVIQNGAVTLRKPFKLIDTDKYKAKTCWFHNYHPDGCLYDADVCAYKH